MSSFQRRHFCTNLIICDVSRALTASHTNRHDILAAAFNRHIIFEEAISSSQTGAEICIAINGARAVVLRVYLISWLSGHRYAFPNQFCSLRSAERSRSKEGTHREQGK